MYYRVEVNTQNIGTILETLYSLNPTRVDVRKNDKIWLILNQLVDWSINENLSLFDVCNYAISQNIAFAEYVPGIWEVLMERARPSNIPYQRTECTFFFKSIEDAAQFKNSYPGMALGTICEVSILDNIYLIECDKKWLDNLDESNVTASDAIEAFIHYWNCDKTDDPLIEILFCGKYKLTPKDI